MPHSPLPFPPSRLSRRFCVHPFNPRTKADGRTKADSETELSRSEVCFLSFSVFLLAHLLREMEFNSVQRGQWPGCQARPSRQIDTLTDGETGRQTNGPTYAKTQEKHGRTLLSGCETDLDPRISCTSCDKRGRGRPSLPFSLPVRHSPTYPSSQPSIINGRQIDREREEGSGKCCFFPILQFPFSDILFPLQTCATRGERRRRRKRRARAAAILIDCGACGQRADQDRRRGRRRGSRWTTTTNGDGMVRFPLPFFPSTKVGGKEGKATPRLPDRGREGAL